MNKQELIAAVSERAGLPKGDTARAVEAVIDVIVRRLGEGGEVRIVGFGSFSMARRKASVGRNPRTGAAIEIAASNHPKFRPGKLLKAIA